MKLSLCGMRPDALLCVDLQRCRSYNGCLAQLKKWSEEVLKDA